MFQWCRSCLYREIKCLSVRVCVFACKLVCACSHADLSRQLVFTFTGSVCVCLQMCASVTMDKYFLCVFVCVLERASMKTWKVNLYMKAVHQVFLSLRVRDSQLVFAFWFSCLNRQLLSQPCLCCLMKDPGTLSFLLRSDRATNTLQSLCSVIFSLIALWCRNLIIRPLCHLVFSLWFGLTLLNLRSVFDCVHVEFFVGEGRIFIWP